jgi:hypothetical protein
MKFFFSNLLVFPNRTEHRHQVMMMTASLFESLVDHCAGIEAKSLEMIEQSREKAVASNRLLQEQEAKLRELEKDLGEYEAIIGSLRGKVDRSSIEELNVDIVRRNEVRAKIRANFGPFDDLAELLPRHREAVAVARATAEGDDDLLTMKKSVHASSCGRAFSNYFDEAYIDPFVILGVRREGQDLQAIAKAASRSYYSLMLKVHPDKRAPSEWQASTLACAKIALEDCRSGLGSSEAAQQD